MTAPRAAGRAMENALNKARREGADWAVRYMRDRGFLDEPAEHSIAYIATDIRTEAALRWPTLLPEGSDA